MTEPTIPGQTDILEVLERLTDDIHLRALYTKSGAVYDTKACQDGRHAACAGRVDVVTGAACSLNCLGPHVGPCRCSCHD